MLGLRAALRPLWQPQSTLRTPRALLSAGLVADPECFSTQCPLWFRTKEADSERCYPKSQSQRTRVHLLSLDLRGMEEIRFNPFTAREAEGLTGQ